MADRAVDFLRDGFNKDVLRIGGIRAVGDHGLIDVRTDCGCGRGRGQGRAKILGQGRYCHKNLHSQVK